MYTLQVSNKLASLIRTLRKKEYRQQHNLFLAEGEKICSELLSSTYETEFIVLRERATDNVNNIAESFAQRGISVYSAHEKQFQSLSDTKNPQGIFALVKIKEDKPIRTENFIALDSISDPGNVGTIIRTADWFGFKQLILSDNCADKYNPKTVRSTMGSLFRCSVIYVSRLADYLRDNFLKHLIYGATLRTNNKLEDISPESKYGLVFGNEAKGISPSVLKILTKEFRIEGGGSESLNVAVAAGIAMYGFYRK
ncbi:MAG: methyltransferase [Ignavibacteria bacterium]|nr:methyltransferase [Ignavibacteria bacterium]